MINFVYIIFVTFSLLLFLSYNMMVKIIDLTPGILLFSYAKYPIIKYEKSTFVSHVNAKYEM